MAFYLLKCHIRMCIGGDIAIIPYCVGAADVINFMDGVNGITWAYALASLVPLALLNAGMGSI